MPTIDELVVKIGLDIKDLQKGQKDVEDALKKSRESAVKHGNAIEGAMAKAAGSFEVLAGKALTVLAIFAGARSIEQFTAKIATMDAAVGRLSASMGRSPDEVSAIGKAVERMGGSADTAMSGLRNLSDAFEDLRTKGSSAIMEPLARLQALSGKSIEFGKDVHKNFLSIADALKAEAAKDPALAHNLGRQILGSDDLTNLAIQGRAGVLAAEAKSRQLGVTTPQDAQAGQNLLTTFRELSQLAEDVGRKIVTAAEPALTAAMKAVEAWTEKNREFIRSGIAEAIEHLVTWLQKFDWDAAAKQVMAFATALGNVATAVGHLAQLFAPGEFLANTLTAFGHLIADRVLTPLDNVLNKIAQVIEYVSKVPSGRDIVEKISPALADRVFGSKDAAPALPETGTPQALPAQQSDATSSGDQRGWWARTMPSWLGGQPAKPDPQARDAVIETAEGVKKLVAQGEKTATGGETGDAAGGHGGGRGGATGGMNGGSFGAKGTSNLRYGHKDGGDVGPYRGAPRATKGALAANQQEAYTAARSEGLSDVAARALVANMSGESLANPRDRHWDRTHYSQGIVQWDPERTARIRAQFGKEPKDMSVAEQTKAALWEMRTRPEYGETNRALQGNDPNAMIGALVRNYERPYDKQAAIHTRQGYYAGFKPNAPSTGASPAGAGTPAPSAAAVTDAERFAAAQRILNGSRDPKDRDLVERYKAQQTKPEKTSFLHGLGRQAPAHVATIATGAQAAAHAAHSTVTHHNDNSSETNIGSIAVHTNATDAHGIAADIGPALQRGQRAAKANYGLGAIVACAVLIAPEVMRLMA